MTDGPTTIATTEYNALWRYYEKMLDNNQALADNYFKAVSVAGAVVGVGSVLVNLSDNTSASSASLLLTLAGFVLLAVAASGHNTIQTASKEMANSSLYLLALEKLRERLWQLASFDDVDTIHEIREDARLRAQDENTNTIVGRWFGTTKSRVRDSRVWILVWINAAVWSVAFLLLGYSLTIGTEWSGATGVVSAYYEARFRVLVVLALLVFFSAGVVEGALAKHAIHRYAEKQTKAAKASDGAGAPTPVRAP